MPVRRPALVHDLRLPLGREVVRLLADDLEDVALPPIERRVLEEEEEDVALGVLGELAGLLALRGDLLPLLLEVLGGVDEGLHVVLRAEARDLRGLRLLVVGDALGPPAAEGRVEVEQVLEAEAVVDELLDLGDPLPRDDAPHARAVVRHLVDPAAVRVVGRRPADGIDRAAAGVEVGVAKAVVVLEEVDVRVDVRHHELLVDERVPLEEVRVRGVVVDDHLVDFREAVLVALREPLVLHAEPPVRVAVREAAVRRDLVHLVVREDLEDGGEEVEARLGGQLLDLVLLVPEVSGERRLQSKFAHFLSCPSRGIL